MKHLILGVALVACGLVACKSSQNTSVTDPNSANMPKAECGAEKAGCAEKAAACGAEKMKSGCCAEKKPQG